MNLQDLLQSASNEAASTVSAPVDLLAWVLGKAGVPISKPVGGSDWMKDKGLMRDVPQSPESLAGQTLGLLSPVAAAAKAPQIARGLLQMGENAAAPRTIAGPSAGQRGMILYHGTNDRAPLREIDPNGGVFNGLFASQNRQAAESHGDQLYRMTVPDSKVLTQSALDYEVARDSAVDAIRKNIKGQHAEEIANMVIDGRSAFNADIPEEDLLKALRAEDVGEADWELQRLRGLLGKRLGFHAVEMPDEHGTSYLVTNGAKPRPANESAKSIVRNGRR